MSTGRNFKAFSKALFTTPVLEAHLRGDIFFLRRFKKSSPYCCRRKLSFKISSEKVTAHLCGVLSTFPAGNDIIDRMQILLLERSPIRKTNMFENADLQRTNWQNSYFDVLSFIWENR